MSVIRLHLNEYWGNVEFSRTYDTKYNPRLCSPVSDEIFWLRFVIPVSVNFKQLENNSEI